METLTITLPTNLSEFVSEQVTRRGMSSASDFFEELLNVQQGHVQQGHVQQGHAESQAELEAKLLEGHGGPNTTFTKDWWRQQQQEWKAEAEATK